MKTLNDLFPETLLVSVKEGLTITTSLKVAEHFHKRHKNVLRDIEKLISDYADLGLRGLKIEPTVRQIPGPKGAVRTEKMYEMDRKAFSILVMRFTGKKALVWCNDFYDAFEAQEKLIQKLSSRWMNVVDQISPNLRPVIEATEQDMNRAQIAELIGKKVGSVTYYRRRGRLLNVLCEN